MTFRAPDVADAQGIAVVFGDLVAAMSRGDMLPEDAAAVASVLELRRKAIETSELEQRLRQMELAQEQLAAVPRRVA